MLTRSGFSIRKLINQRRSQEGEDAFEYDAIAHVRAEHQQRSQSWISREISARKRKGPPEPIVIRHAQAFHSVETPPPVPQLPDTPPRSLSGSPSRWGSRADGPPRTADHSRQSSKSLSPNSRNSSQLSRQQTVSRRRTTTPRKPYHETSPRPSLNLPEKRGHFMDLEERSRRVTVDPSRLEGWSESVQQLMHETDQAFKNAGLLTPEQHVFVPRTSLDKDLPPLPLNTPDKSRPSSANSAASRNETPKLVTTSPNPMPSPLAIPTISKAKRKKAGKKNRRRKSNLAAPKQHHARWTLGENVAELFSGFKKVEADEMITPEDVEEFRRNRLNRMKHKKSGDSLRSDTSDVEAEDCSDTPVEPFHLDDLPTRIGAAGVKTAISPIDVPVWQPSFGSVIRRDFSVSKESSAEDIIVSPMTPEDDYLPIMNDAEIPCPPPKNPARLSRSQGSQGSQNPQGSQESQGSQSPQLPAIPELLVTCPENRRHRPTSMMPFPASDPFSSSEDDDFVYLKSTPCTLTHPGYMHGAIRFSKSDLNMKMASDNTLDWTAFQMAILGGVGDFFYGSSDWHYEQHSENDEAERLAEWFEDFGFETFGELITNENMPFEASPSTCEYSPVSAMSTEDLDLPIPVAHEHPTGFWNDGDCDTSKFVTEGCGIKRWTVEGHPKPYAARDSVDSSLTIPSLPQSPMLPIIITGQEGDNVDIVPMGYNLGHDLGDFLRWEAEHVYAGDYNDKDMYE